MMFSLVCVIDRRGGILDVGRRGVIGSCRGGLGWFSVSVVWWYVVVLGLNGWVFGRVRAVRE